MAYQHEAKCLCDEEKWTIKNVQDKLLAEESLHAIELKVENTFMKDYFSIEEQNEIIRIESEMEEDKKMKKNTYFVAASKLIGGMLKQEDLDFAKRSRTTKIVFGENK